MPGKPTASISPAEMTRDQKRDIWHAICSVFGRINLRELLPEIIAAGINQEDEKYANIQFGTKKTGYRYGR